MDQPCTKCGSLDRALESFDSALAQEEARGEGRQCLPDGRDMGMRGLTEATQRMRDAMSETLIGRGAAPVAIALGEALFWLAAVDDYFKNLCGETTYFQQRAADEGGRTTGGLVFARNMLGHGLNTASAIRFDLPAPTLIQEGGDLTVRWARLPGKDYGAPNRGTAMSIRFVWARLDELPKPTGPQHDRDAWYAELIAGKALSAPLDVAAAWFAAQRGDDPIK